jgi:hypothetical protein
MYQQKKKDAAFKINAMRKYVVINILRARKKDP